MMTELVLTEKLENNIALALCWFRVLVSSEKRTIFSFETFLSSSS